MELAHVLIRGAREHNLRSIDVKIPKKKLVVLTGVSGSGKSSLAFDTLYADGQRRYVESLSAYARQFLGQMEKPKYDSIRGLSPTISIEQKTTGSNPRSTVGTITEISDYLRVLYARVGVQHCHRCGRAVRSQTAQQIARELLSAPEKTRLLILAPLLVNRKGEHRELLAETRRAGFVRIRADGEIVLTEDVQALDKRRKHTIEVVVDRVVVKSGITSRVTGSVETALRTGQGVLIASTPGSRTASSRRRWLAPTAESRFQNSRPRLFVQQPAGDVRRLQRLGDPRGDRSPARHPRRLPVHRRGAIKPWGLDVSEKSNWTTFYRAEFCEAMGVDMDRPWRKLPKRQREILLYGSGDREFTVDWEDDSGEGTFDMVWEGAIPRLMRRFLEASSERAKRWHAQWIGNARCSSCDGHRLRPESAAVRLGKGKQSRTIVEVSAMTVDDARHYFSELKLSGAAAEIAAEVFKEVRARLDFLSSVGLGYLSLDRAGPSLSGGESQRIRLASQVGSELTGVIYILDEPSIGLHQRDNRRLLETLTRMRDIGNTVVVVEHDEETIRAADHVIDFGPGAGVAGGRIVHAGTPKSLEKNPRSLTGAYLSGAGRNRDSLETTRTGRKHQDHRSGGKQPRRSGRRATPGCTGGRDWRFGRRKVDSRKRHPLPGARPKIQQRDAASR